MRFMLSMLLLTSLVAFAKPVQKKLYVSNIQMSYEIDSEIWKWEREFSPKSDFHDSAFFRNDNSAEKTIRIGISKVANFPDEKKPRALRSLEEIPKLFTPDGGGIGNCSFGDLEGYVQQGKDESGEFIHVIMMEPTFGGIVFFVARNIPMEDLEGILQTIKTKVQQR